MGKIHSRHSASTYFLCIGDEPEQMLEPIRGYASKPIVSLEKACEPLHAIVPGLNQFVNTAKSKSGNPGNNLTQDESAAIRLYTMQSDKKIDDLNASIYAILNRTLRDPDRRKLQPWFLYLKLLLTALTKLPSTSIKSVWRGIRDQDSTNYVENHEIVWWGFSSCTKSLNVLKSSLFLGKTGTRTIFSIETFDARSVKDHSDYPNEDEVLLLPGTCMKVRAKLDPEKNLCIIELKQIHSSTELLERPYTGKCADSFYETVVFGNNRHRILRVNSTIY